ncbi:Extended synaptotagmin-1 [Apophysomyces ossiformis]|uniref:Extended synaptotagmin-1 n=1 Tax=Apophysomyces ossiformis TaxID=679940 RepID=A0A8H7ET02_9FUNG|nr:Extended synaptotagmin-1 [Apophysomyces ossiformis]
MFSSHSAPRGTLTVQLLEARKLHDEDTVGKSDPFVELWLNEHYKQRSEVVKSSDAPVWNQTFTFPIEEGSSVHKLYFKVLDKDVLDTDKIGEGKIDFSSAFQGEVIDEWVKLPAHLGLTSHGEVHVVISFQAE